MKRHFLTGLLAGSACAFLFPITAAAGLKRAEELFERKEYDRAKREIAADTAALEGERLDEALFLLARLETDTGRAESLYRRILRSGNERVAAGAAIELANFAYATGDYAGALAFLEPRRTGGGERAAMTIHYLRGLCCKQLGENARARAELGAVTRGEYASWSAFARADIDLQEGRAEAAVQAFEELERKRANPIVGFKLGECYEASGEKERALAAYRALVERFPQSLEATKGREKILLLEQSKATPDGEKSAGGGETGERRSQRARSSIPAGRGFTIQFGSFGARGNAAAVAGKLEKLLSGVRVESVEMDGRIWHRVRAGFYETREAAAADAARAKERTGIAGAVIPLK